MINTCIPYLVFPGTCERALNFYSSIFNGVVSEKMSFGESPISVDAHLKERLFNADFKADAIHFKASDDLPAHPVVQGSNISLFIAFSDLDERGRIFNELAQEGQVLFPLSDDFGMLKDQFGIQWMVVMQP